MWPNPQFPADLVALTEEIANGNLHFFVQWWNESDENFTSLVHL